MKIAVMGAGAIGCYYGAKLAQAGHDITLIGRQNHVDAIKRDGLCLDLGDTQTYIPISASTEPAAAQGADLVLVCVKSGDTTIAAQELKPFLKPEAIILSLQNGVENVDLLSAVLDQPVLPVLVYVATAMGGPGRICYYGRGELVLGPSPYSPSIVDTFIAAGIPSEVSENAEDALWAKLIVNCAYNAISAIPHLPYREMIKAPGIWDVMRDTMNECIAVAEACDISVPDDMWDIIVNVAKSAPNQFSSTAQDLARGKASEIDFINGLIVRKGKELGIPTPTNQALYTLTKLCEAKPA